MNKEIYTRKIELKVHIPEEITKSEEQKKYKDNVWDILRKINQQNFELLNYINNKYIEFEAKLQDILFEDKEYLKLKKEYLSDTKNKKKQKAFYGYVNDKRKELAKKLNNGKTWQNFGYTNAIKFMSKIPKQDKYLNSYTYGGVATYIYTKFKSVLKDVLIGKRTYNYYKNDAPIPIVFSNGNFDNWFEFNEKNGNYYLLSKFSNKQPQIGKNLKKTNRFFKLKVHFGRDKSDNKAILNKIKNEDSKYSLSDSAIQVKDKKIYLLLTYKYINDKENELDKNKVLGVDLGMHTAAYLTTNFNKKIRISLGGDKELLKYKTNIVEKKERQQKFAKYNRSGHGRHKLLQNVYLIKDKERRFRDTYNHKVSKDIINAALKYNCSIIHIEDLSSIKNKKDLIRNKVLANWTYFDLITKIDYKAKKYGINVVKVNPAYTSQVCHICGEWHPENRIVEEKDGKIFPSRDFICHNPECKMYNKKMNADYNASRNIALNNIDVEKIRKLEKVYKEKQKKINEQKELKKVEEIF